MFILYSNRLRLINADAVVLARILEGDLSLGQYLNVQVQPGWSSFEDRVFRYALEQLTTTPEMAPWLTYLPIHQASNELIGSCGFKGLPDDEGMVELGYEIRSAYRNQGLATELTGCLLDYAFAQSDVEMVQAHTQGDDNASCRVLLKNGFQKDRSMLEAEAGAIWRWIRTK
ncbi:MAG: GNAT family N-acetyltransferase [Bacteroidota bacterium]